MTTLRTAAKAALWAFQCHVEQTWPMDRSTAAIAALRAALAQQDEPCLNCASLEAQNTELDRKLAEMERAEPAAVVGTQVDVWRGWDVRWAPPGGPIKTALMLKDMPVGTMLYTTPPKRQPLSGLEVERLLEQVIGSLPAARNLVRAVERAHGIIEPRIEEDSHQTLDDAMQQPRAMAQAYENGYKAGVAARDAEHQQTLALQQRSYEREIQLDVEAERERCLRLIDEHVRAVDAENLVRAIKEGV